jgi:hypothetical protein
LLGCTVQLVAPYNSELAQRASSMQAEVVAWDLRMRNGAGTTLADPRHPDVAATLNKWRGEADAMLTIAISNDPGTVNCSEAVKTVSAAIEGRIAAELRAAIPPAVATGGGVRGCETALVAAIGTGIDDVERALKYCRADWIGDTYFVELGQSRFTALKPPAPPNPTAQETLRRSCFAEFRPSSNAPADALAAARHGRAVSSLSTTLQAIVYLENRKKAALVSK